MADELLRALGRRQAQPPPGVGPDLHAQSEVAHAMLRPFEAQERAELLDGILDQLGALDGESTRPGPKSEVESEREREAEAESERERESEVESEREAEVESEREAEVEPEREVEVLPLAPRRRSRVLWIGVVTAIAAALLLWVGLTPDSISPASGPVLPPYAVTRLGGGTATVRSADAGPPEALVLAPDASIDWVFTPRSPVRTPVGVVLLATSPDHAAVLGRPQTPQVSAEGVVRISGPLTEVLPLSPGTWSILVVLGDPAALPQTADAAAEGGTWSRLRFEVKITTAR